MKAPYLLSTTLVHFGIWLGASAAHAAPGSVIAWGWNFFGQTSIPVAAQSGVTAIAAGGRHTVALKSDGTVIVWGGDTSFHQTNVPTGLSGVMAIASGGYHIVVLKSDGSVAAWGNNGAGETNVPGAAQSGVVRSRRETAPRWP